MKRLSEGGPALRLGENRKNSLVIRSGLFVDGMVVVLYSRLLLQQLQASFTNTNIKSALLLAQKASLQGIRDRVKENYMKAATERKIIRWLHILISIPIAGYIYGPLSQIPDGAFMVKAVFFPVLVVSGFWLWLGHKIRKWKKQKAARLSFVHKD